MKKMFHRITLVLAATIAISQSIGQTLGDAQALYDGGLYEEALEIVEIQQFDDARAWFIKANCLHKMESFNEALMCYRQAKKLGYADDDILLNAGICAFSAGELENAEEAIWKYLGRHDDDPVALYYMGAIEYMRLDNKRSVEYLQMAIDLNPDYNDALYLMGANMMEKRKYHQATSWFEQAAHSTNAEPRAELNLALVQIELMNFEGALKVLKEIEKGDPTFMPEVYYYMGEAHFALKNQEQACDFWSRAMAHGDADAERNYQGICEQGKQRVKKKRRSYSEF
jgi:tetratricopeptide (TPR) repeat protein